MGNERNLPILYVVQTGTPFPRWMIANEIDEFWDGDRFTANATLYAKHADAAVAAQNILKSHFEGVEPVKFVVPLIVGVFSDKPIDAHEIAEHLSKASTLYLNVTEHGHGPDNSLVLPTIHWTEIKKEADEG